MQCEKNARVSYWKTIEIAWAWSTSVIWSFWKTHECICFFQIARETILFLINNILDSWSLRFQARNTCEVNHLTHPFKPNNLIQGFNCQHWKCDFVLLFSKYISLYFFALYFNQNGRNIFSCIGIEKREIPAFMYFKSFITSLTSILTSFAFSLFLLIGHRRSVDGSMSSTIPSSGNSIVYCLWLDDLVVFTSHLSSLRTSS